MSRKLLIVNNGLRNLGGHYFETAVSIADAARKLGFKPVLAAHVTCPDDLVPDWLECYPLFCTDHWMCGPPAPAVHLQGVRETPVKTAPVPIEAVLAGKHTLDDYLFARFETADLPPDLLNGPVPQSPLPWKARVKGAVRDAVPPLFWVPLRWLYHRRHAPAAAAKSVLRNALPPFAFAGLRALKHRLAHRNAPADGCPAPEPETPSPAADMLPAALAEAHAGHEWDYMRIFHRDLARLFRLVGVDGRDHVFLPTAHGRELVAVQRLAAAMRPTDVPTFHLEFRHSLDMSYHCANPDDMHPYTVQHQVFFDHFRSRPHDPRVRLYTDTPELTEEYEQLSGLPFRTLPIPFRIGLLAPRPRRAEAPVCVAFFGNVREEKGFWMLPGLVDALMKDYVRTGKVRFLIQGSLADPVGEKRSYEALCRLQRLPEKYVTLVGVDDPLPAEEYYRLVSEADLLVCPYQAEAYRRRSSGTFTEAVAAGIPTVVPKDTWLERQQPAGTGEAFTDLESLVAAVRTVVDDFPQYLRAAKAHRESWLAHHTPMNLVKALLQPAEGAGCCRPLAEVA